MKRTILILLLIGSVTAISLAQSTFLEKGRNGFEIGGSFSSNTQHSGFSGEIGYSISGVVDLGVSVSRFLFPKRIIGRDLYGYIITPSVSWLLLKQREGTTFTIGVEGGYQKEIYRGAVLSNNDIDISGDYFYLGTTILTDLEASETVRIRPEAVVQYGTGESRTILPTRSEINRSNFLKLGLGLGLNTDTSPEKTLALTPRIWIQRGGVTFEISLRYVFPRL